ncbi:PREDICTED: pumilio homolog 2 isoform X1 [Dufourea novaeangliae]|uniref:pumilio homolog 2 isoform X1 n=1 Tax=Dufourea novaeangliae TaxID=178035 RepID=UPI000766E8CB|nr:PREDICTED: pumilio homolog 2 isoform X1 [Dufourea novaeangliae]
MKWLGASSAGAAGEPAPSVQLHHPSANGHIPTDAEQCGQVMAGGDSMRIQPGQTHQIGVSRTQDDAMVGYVFQRPTEPEFNAQSSTFQTKQAPRAWALADDAIIDNNPEKWKYPITKLNVPQQNQPQQLGLQTMNNVHLPYEIHPMQLKSGAPGAEHLVYLNNQMTAQQQVALFHHQQQQQQQQFRNGQIAPSAKKLWGVDEGGSKDEGGVKGGGILHLGDHQMWRDSTWSTSDHAVSQPISMGTGRRVGVGTGYHHQTSEVGTVLSPRSSETGGLGVKMVEYVLGSSPTTPKDLEPRMVSLRLNTDADKKEKEKGSASPFDSSKDDTGPQNNGLASQNGLDDDKGFNRTPGSRQPSPGEEEFQKNAAATLAVSTGGGGVVLLKPGVDVVGSEEHFMAAFAPAPPHHLQHHQAPPTHHLQHPHSHAAQLFGAQAPPPPQGPPPSQPSQQQQGPPQPQDTTTHFDVQQLFRSQPQGATPQQLQLLQQQQQQQQQQYLAASQAQQQQQQQQQQNFPTAPYTVISGQEPYVGALIAGAPPPVVPQYYGVAPWVYPAGLLPQAPPQAAAPPPPRRPLTPSSAAAAAAAAQDTANNLAQTVQGQYQVIPAYYDQNGSIVMGGVRGLSSAATPMRLVSPAPVLVNRAPSQPPPGPPAPPPPSLYSQPTPTSHSNATPGECLGLAACSAAAVVAQAQAVAVQQAQQQGSGLAAGLAALGYGGSPLGALGSPAQLQSTGLGLGASSTARRDSFDRNTSAFSPSLEYSRAKWPQSYGALGTVTASPSPLGLSLTPPPSLGGSLGGLVGGANRVSAAPGAEAKFRASAVPALTANGVFGSSSSLFPTLVGKPGRGGTTSIGDKNAGGRSRLLEDFRNNRFPNLQLRDLVNHIVEFSQDQHGSRFIQQKLERASANEKQLVFQEILTSAYSLMTDVFGNYVIQKFFEFGTPEQKSTLAQKVRGHVLPLALQMYGCRVIQKALESIGAEQQQEIVRELDGHVLKCVKDQNGNHVVQKCIECVEPRALQFVIGAFAGQVYSLSTHPYGCRVIQRILEHCTPEQTQGILQELHAATDQLIQDQYGNYVIQHVLEHGKPEDKAQLISSVRGKVLTLSQHKFASNVVEKCVTHATRQERAVLIEEVCGFNDNALNVMMKDQYANYVVQKMIDVAEPAQRKVLMHKIRPHLGSLRKYTYGKHIIVKLEKFFMKTASAMGVATPAGASSGGGDLGPIGPPASAAGPVSTPAQQPTQVL